ncbi:N-acyl homoserine lactonase family protein [Pantoea agglomerans]|jgi:glyoxylase-like metal-dependent hydrolase (beta-lactamase superfamily II)|uniref:N-acyl homoserine lactonase family protein n=1 Tax=Enterobacter agglomerans TaxID=549 RepID=UPI00093B0DE8|nr:N-acyl homoserine lactonase family protein [Pantoea agglomerans]MDF2874503.1 Zn-dependent hydrolase [Sporomusa sp.]WNK57237.1 N-acyl homoserine lactonase family protein [Pantoea agglomerans]
MIPEYEVYALRYAEHRDRSRNENFISHDEHDNSPMPLDFYCWLIRSEHAVLMVDTGFNRELAKKRNRHYYTSPEMLLKKLGINADSIDKIIVTHMHYDHIGNLKAFPNALLYMQEKEMHYCTGRNMLHRYVRAPYDSENIANAVYRLHEGKVRYVGKREEILPGIETLHVGGHTDGLQIVTVNTARGKIVLASDAAHYWCHVDDSTPFPIVMNIPDMLSAHETIKKLVSGMTHIIPGHDPQVRTVFPQFENEENIVQLHLDPTGEIHAR